MDGRAKGAVAVTKETVSRRPYSPSFIHAFYAWLDRLPIPAWFSLVLLVPIIGIAQHLVAWRKAALAPGQFSFDLGTAGYWLGIFLIGIHVLKGAPKSTGRVSPALACHRGGVCAAQIQVCDHPERDGVAVLSVWSRDGGRRWSL